MSDSDVDADRIAFVRDGKVPVVVSDQLSAAVWIITILVMVITAIAIAAVAMWATKDHHRNGRGMHSAASDVMMSSTRRPSRVTFK